MKGAIKLDENDKGDLATAISVLTELHDTGKVDSDFLHYIGMLCLSLAERVERPERIKKPR
jgi:hypothetical protein